jgi:hypothetical protein
VRSIRFDEADVREAGQVANHRVDAGTHGLLVGREGGARRSASRPPARRRSRMRQKRSTRKCATLMPGRARRRPACEVEAKRRLAVARC